MFEEVLGIPAHPLLVHAAVVFVPLQILAAFAYAFVPFVRQHIAWLVISLAVVAPVCAFLAKQSGEAFQARLIRNGTAGGDLLQKINEHSRFGGRLEYLSVGLSVLMALLVFVQVMRSRRSASVDASAAAGTPSASPVVAKGPVILAALLTVAVVVVGAFTGYYVFKAGDTGAHIVWSSL